MLNEKENTEMARFVLINMLDKSKRLTNPPVRQAGSVLKLSAPKRRARAEVQQLVAQFMSSGMRRSDGYPQDRGSTVRCFAFQRT
jgi:hypothetical protein